MEQICSGGNMNVSCEKLDEFNGGVHVFNENSVLLLVRDGRDAVIVAVHGLLAHIFRLELPNFDTHVGRAGSCVDKKEGFEIWD